MEKRQGRVNLSSFTMQSSEFLLSKRIVSVEQCLQNALKNQRDALYKVAVQHLQLQQLISYADENRQEFGISERQNINDLRERSHEQFAPKNVRLLRPILIGKVSVSIEPDGQLKIFGLFQK